MYQKIVEEFRQNPREVATCPLGNRTPKWFYVFVEKDKLCVEGAHQNSPKSTVKKRSLMEKECEPLLAIYHKRQRGERVTQEATESTYSQVYWYGIFAEMGL